MADNPDQDQDQGITAYHGSPHEFDQFDISKIGTGEGAQAYGHGLYFAEAEPVAREYRNMLAPPSNPTIDGKPIDRALLRDVALDAGIESPGGAINNLQSRLRSSDDVANYSEKLSSIDLEDLRKTFPSVAKEVETEKKIFEELVKRGLNIERPAKGHMYEVRINAHPDHFLDWDKPLSEQSEYVQNALREHTPLQRARPYSPNTKGEDIYYRNTQGIRGKDIASQELHRLGIKGIKYLDQGSRGAGEGSRNYVVFDDKLVNVRRKYEDGGRVGYDNGGEASHIPYDDPRYAKNLAKFLAGNHPDVPHVVFHGTDRDILAFDPEKTKSEGGAFFFARDSWIRPNEHGARSAGTYASKRGGTIFPVHLSMKNPHIVGFTKPLPAKDAPESEWDNYFAEHKKFDDQFNDDRFKERYYNRAIQYAKDNGHDGVIFKDITDDRIHHDIFSHPSDIFAVFHPAQIKSAIGNQGTFDPANIDITKAGGGEVESPDIPQIDNAISVFPKPQRMFPNDAPVPGGQYLNAATKEDMTGHKAAMASIGVQPGGKPYFRASPDSVDETGTPGRGSAMAKTNLFKQKAGWRWAQAPEGHEATDTIVSVEHRGQHHYTLNAHFPKGVDFARYENSPTEPRLRPTTKGNVILGPKVGSILVRGKEHPVYEHVIVKNKGGEVESYPLRSHHDWEEAHDYEKTGGKLGYESPSEYLKEVKPLNMDHDDKKLIHHFKKQMKKGEKLDPVAIYPDGHPNGRHRAHAAEDLGIKKIPVVKWPKKKKGGGPVVDQALMVISRRRAPPGTPG